MNSQSQNLRNRLARLSRVWIDQGLPTREVLMETAADLEAWKTRTRVRGIWTHSPRMATATLDDGMGHGLALIERYARILGLTVHSLGLMAPVDKILSHCREAEPEFLGLTVLQLDSDDDLCRIGHHLPGNCRLIAGGAAFRYDPELAERCRVNFVAANLARFIQFLLTQPGGAGTTKHTKKHENKTNFLLS